MEVTALRSDAEGAEKAAAELAERVRAQLEKFDHAPNGTINVPGPELRVGGVYVTRDGERVERVERVDEADQEELVPGIFAVKEGKDESGRDLYRVTKVGPGDGWGSALAAWGYRVETTEVQEVVTAVSPRNATWANASENREVPATISGGWPTEDSAPRHAAGHAEA